MYKIYSRGPAVIVDVDGKISEERFCNVVNMVNLIIDDIENLSQKRKNELEVIQKNKKDNKQ